VLQDGRRKRNDASVELRKVKKEDQLMKRRNVTDIDIEEPVSPLQERSGVSLDITLLTLFFRFSLNTSEFLNEYHVL